MRIQLISPTHYLPDGSLHKTTRYWTSGTTLPYLKALTPPGHEVSFSDELMHDLDVERIARDADVVGITAMGPQIRRAYDLADHFRARGKQVVLGGTWVTLTAGGVAARTPTPSSPARRSTCGRRCSPTSAAGRSQGIYRAARWHDLQGSSRDRPVEPAAAEGRRVPHELALPHVLLLAGLLLARLPAPLRVLRRADLLPADASAPGRSTSSSPRYAA